MKKYIITQDYHHFIYLSDRGMAERLANEIRGAVYLPYGDEMLLVYAHTDQQ